MRSNGLLPILSTMLFCFSIAYSQEKEIGFKLGLGQTHIDNNALSLPSFKDPINFQSFGITYYQTAKDAYFNLNVGINYDCRGKDEYRLNYIRSPFGMELNVKLKKTIIFILGGGFFASYLINYEKVPDENDFEESKNRFQVGTYINMGTGIQITDKYALTITYRNNRDITRMYAEERTSPGGAPYSEIHKGYDGFIAVSLKYNLLK